MRLGVARMLACVAVASVAAMRSNAPAIAQTTSDCATPDVPPRVIRPAMPRAPKGLFESQQQGVVEVRVDLDDQSRLVNASVYHSSNAAFNDAALAATRDTEFRTQIKDCRPVAASYRYVVEFQVQPYDPMEFYRGRWRCTSDGVVHTVDYTTPTPTKLVRHAIADASAGTSADETIDYDEAKSTWTLNSQSANAAVRATASRVPLASWSFAGERRAPGSAPVSVTIDYERATNDNFTRVDTTRGERSHYQVCTREGGKS